MFLLKKHVSDLYTRGPTLTAHSLIETNARSVLERNTIIINRYTLTYETLTDPDYDVLSHELGHVLLNEDHNQIRGNFLSEFYDCMNISQNQCNKIKTRWI